METLVIRELIAAYGSSQKKSHRSILKSLINSITNTYFMEQQNIDISTWNCRQTWLARKYSILWRLKTTEQLARFKPFNLIDYRTWVCVVDVYDGDTMKVIMNYRGNIDQWTVRMDMIVQK